MFAYTHSCMGLFELCNSLTLVTVLKLMIYLFQGLLLCIYTEVQLFELCDLMLVHIQFACDSLTCLLS